LPAPSWASSHTVAVSTGTSIAAPVNIPFQNPHRGFCAAIPSEDRALTLDTRRSTIAARSSRFA
jgi:hypothetical protein